MSVWFDNIWTTLVGAVFAVVNYLTTAGVKIPTNREEWKAFWVSLFMVAIGATAKDFHK